MNNDPYNTVIEYQGRRYRYDPDFDCFYPLRDHKETHLSQFGWIYVCAVCLAVAAYFTIWPV